SCGRNERLNTVPESCGKLKPAPPYAAVPYSVLRDKINPAVGLAPLLKVKLCRVVKPVPSVLTANTVPAPELPPLYAVPYRVLPDKNNPARGLAPSLLVPGYGPEVAVKLYRVVKVCAVTRPAGIKLSTAISAGRTNR